MLRSRQQFVKVTKRGSLQKVVREHYLREDIPCGIKGCGKCSSFDTYQECISPTKPILIIDTNIALHQLDILQDPAIDNIYLCTTVLEETRHRNQATYQALRALTQQRDRSVFVFSNEHHAETYLAPESSISQSANDRNDAAIRRVAEWLSRHYQSLHIVFISDDVASRDLARSELSADVEVRSMAEFVNLHAIHLQDKLALSTFTEPEVLSFVPYTEYIPMSEAVLGVESGKYVKGTFTISAYNVLQASVVDERSGREVQVSGKMNMNRAVHGDLVAVEILPEQQWKSADDEILVETEDEAEAQNMQSVPDGSSMSISSEMKISCNQNSSPSKLIIPSAKVVAIFKRNWRAYCGSILPPRNSAASASVKTALFIPVDRRIPAIRISTSQFSALLRKRITVSIDSWPTTSKHPLGHFRSFVGGSNSDGSAATAGNHLSTETEVVLIEHEIPYAPFPPAVLDCLPTEGEKWKPTDADYQSRADFRHLPVCSIDPPGCTDIDDALHARPLDPLNPSTCNWEIGVHIADVSHFVLPSTALDTEAANRSTSVYLVDRRIDMLPELLGSNLCSLRCDSERLAFSVVWQVTQQGEIVSVEFLRSVIRSVRSFTYDEAQEILDSKEPFRQGNSSGSQSDISLTHDSHSVIAPSLHFLYKISQILRSRRIASGALTLASPEVKFKLGDGVDGTERDPLDVEIKQIKGANMLVEEFMLLANIAVANRIYAAFPDHALLRKHPTPPQSNFTSLKSAIDTYIQSHGISTSDTVPISLDPSTNLTLSQSLDRLHDPADPYFNTLVRILTTRCMMQAVYFVSGNSSAPDFYHYGLAAPIYTHFTSPIRRYADLLVHRLLSSAIGASTTSNALISKVMMSSVCDNMNYRHRMAQYASRASVSLYTCLFLKEQRVRNIDESNKDNESNENNKDIKNYKDNKNETRNNRSCNNYSTINSISNTSNSTNNTSNNTNKFIAIDKNSCSPTFIENGYVIKVCKNGFVVFVPKYGVEGLIRITDELISSGSVIFDSEKSQLIRTDIDAKNINSSGRIDNINSNNCSIVIASMFQQVRVRMFVEELNFRNKLCMSLVE